MRPRILLALAFAALFVLPVAGAVVPPVTSPPQDTTGCTVNTKPAFSPTGHFYWGETFIDATLPVPGATLDLYVERNGIPGLQRDTTHCSDGRTIQSDLCLARYGTHISYCARLLPFEIIP